MARLTTSFSHRISLKMKINKWSILSVILLVYAIMILFKYGQSRSWESTTGFIINKEKKVSSFSIEYVYSVEGKIYYGGRSIISVLPYFYAVENHNKALCGKEVGDFSKVYYNSDQHEESSLTKNYSIFEVGLALIIIILLSLYILLLKSDLLMFLLLNRTGITSR